MADAAAVASEDPHGGKRWWDATRSSWINIGVWVRAFSREPKSAHSSASRTKCNALSDTAQREKGGFSCRPWLSAGLFPRPLPLPLPLLAYSSIDHRRSAVFAAPSRLRPTPSKNGKGARAERHATPPNKIPRCGAPLARRFKNPCISRGEPTRFTTKGAFACVALRPCDVSAPARTSLPVIVHHITRRKLHPS